MFESTLNGEPMVNRSMFKYLQPHPVLDLIGETLLDFHVVIGRLGPVRNSNGMMVPSALAV